jgi:hypothetical protein
MVSWLVSGPALLKGKQAVGWFTPPGRRSRRAFPWVPCVAGLMPCGPNYGRSKHGNRAGVIWKALRRRLAGARQSFVFFGLAPAPRQRGLEAISRGAATPSSSPAMGASVGLFTKGWRQNTTAWQPATRQLRESRFRHIHWVGYQAGETRLAVRHDRARHPQQDPLARQTPQQASPGAADRFKAADLLLYSRSACSVCRRCNAWASVTLPLAISASATSCWDTPTSAPSGGLRRSRPRPPERYGATDGNGLLPDPPKRRTGTSNRRRRWTLSDGCASLAPGGGRQDDTIERTAPARPPAAPPRPPSPRPSASSRGPEPIGGFRAPACSGPRSAPAIVRDPRHRSINDGRRK